MFPHGSAGRPCPGALPSPPVTTLRSQAQETRGRVTECPRTRQRRWLCSRVCILNASDCRFEVVKTVTFLSRDLTPIKEKKSGPHSRLLISDPSRARPASGSARSRCLSGSSPGWARAPGRHCLEAGPGPTAGRAEVSPEAGPSQAPVCTSAGVHPPPAPPIKAVLPLQAREDACVPGLASTG